MTRHCDVVVIGGGASGENAAERAARGGLQVMLVEAELVGGACSYWACIPSKALLRPGSALAAARAVAGVDPGALDRSAVLARRDRFTHGWDDSSQREWLAGAGIELLRGHARLAGPRRVLVDDQELLARQAVVVATGSRAVVPGVPGLAEAHPWTSREATSMPQVPTSVAIIGGGVVAVEMATALLDLGSKVTLVVRGSGVLSRFEPFAAEAVLEALQTAGARVLLDTEAAAVHRESGEVHLELTSGDTVVAAEVLVATGRRPVTDDLGIESVGLTPGEPLSVDDTGRVTAVPEGWLYAVGDVTGRTATTHQGKYDARVAGAAIAHRADPSQPLLRAEADPRGAPQVVFTRPEVATVGHTRAAAEAAGAMVRVVQVPFTSAAGASLLADEYLGTAQLVVDAARETVLGATFVGPDVAELLHAATIAVVAQVPLSRLWHAVPAFPTLSEIWLRLLEEYGL